MSSCWVEVNTDALRHNYRETAAIVGASASIIAVVKANAYGHGAPEVARVFSAEGAAMLAVTRLDEALPLRASGLLSPILLLTPPLPDEAEEVVSQNLTASVSSVEEAKRLSNAAKKQGKTARVHLKINTGMGRLGVEPELAIETAQQIAALENLELEAAFTHFAFAAERDPSDTHLQFGKFQPLVQLVARAAGVKPTSFHCANSAALLRFPSMRLSCVRPGTILYGQYPSVQAREAAEQMRAELRDGFSVKARVLAVKTLRPGQSVGYGGEWKAKRESRIATLAIGYADGLTQTPSARSLPPSREMRASLKEAARHAAHWTGLKKLPDASSVVIRGERAPLIGRIAMQQCSIDVTHLPQVEAGDAATLSMRRISAGAHLPRVYVRDD